MYIEHISTRTYSVKFISTVYQIHSIPHPLQICGWYRQTSSNKNPSRAQQHPFLHSIYLFSETYETQILHNIFCRSYFECIHLKHVLICRKWSGKDEFREDYVYPHTEKSRQCLYVYWLHVVSWDKSFSASAGGEGGSGVKQLFRATNAISGMV